MNEWGWGASGVGVTFPHDRVRCDNCRRWTKTPLWFGLIGRDPYEGRPLCPKHARARVITCEGGTVT